jgi:hypothetical protein
MPWTLEQTLNFDGGDGWPNISRKGFNFQSRSRMISNFLLFSCTEPTRREWACLFFFFLCRKLPPTICKLKMMHAAKHECMQRSARQPAALRCGLFLTSTY